MCGTRCWLHPAHPPETGGRGSCGEERGRSEAAPGLDSDPGRSGSPETVAQLLCTARTRPLLPPPMDFHSPTAQVRLSSVAALLPGTSAGFLTGLGAVGGMV